MEDLPTLGMRKLIPKIVGQDTKVFQGWTGRQHDMQKTLMVEADEQDVGMIQYLAETAKNRRIFKK